ncbi:hypothetical protein [Actinomadura parmotrematis]|uniref:Uncharacterized protein n=1 Tax=Actinomadura parmotrematis TaxID=2864039 RepID=A0ABS7FPE7_9ACTN|nr:hypothetical protein [Actinomadura parmotrematis]MBW8482263.1 hypothetical protein [Actinomadura parmotrematis]
MPNTRRTIKVSIREVRSKNFAAREILAALSDALPHLVDLWFRLNAALDDVPAMLAEIKRLRAELFKARRARANLAAAARATLNAHHDGEPDPLYYLRDELRAQRLMPPGTWPRP